MKQRKKSDWILRNVLPEVMLKEAETWPEMEHEIYSTVYITSYTVLSGRRNRSIQKQIMKGSPHFAFWSYVDSHRLKFMSRGYNFHYVRSWRYIVNHKTSICPEKNSKFHYISICSDTQERVLYLF